VTNMSLDNPEFRRRLHEVASEIISDPERKAVYEADGLTAIRAMPGLVVLPATVSEVQAIVALCNEYQVPLVARGAGTGLSGGATPHHQGVLLVLARFNQILSINQDNLTATVQPGVTNLAISDAVSDLGFYYAPDPSSQIACTIGGNVAENSGGVHCLKYGLTVHNVRQIKVVMPDGRLKVMGQSGLDSPGLDWLALLHGSEGMLGIVVEVVVQLLPKPPSVVVLMAAFSSIKQAADSVSDVIGQGILPAGLEMMDKLAIQAAEAFIGAGYPIDAAALLLCELDGHASEIERLSQQVTDVFEKNGAISVSAATDETARQKLWQGRKAAFPAVGRIAPDYYCMDGTIPRRELSAVLAEISRLSAKYDLQVANVFHAGDGNLHPLILFDANEGDQLRRAESFGSDILQLCIEKGGTITGEHGVGLEKINEMCAQFTETELSIFHGIKNAFDPRGILNPEKAIPTLSRCAEFGAMHVHVGEEKFPELERF
jgi:glycolate oxidase